MKEISLDGYLIAAMAAFTVGLGHWCPMNMVVLSDNAKF